MLAIFKREFKSYFTSPLGYIVLAAYYFFLGYYFVYMFQNGSPYIHAIITAMSTIVLITSPAITMRLFSEERRQKTDQILLTSPVKLSSVVMGKFLAAFSVHAIGFVPTVIFQIIVSSYVSVSIFTYLYSLVGIMLFGAALIAIGMFVSSLTESPVISIFVTLVINIAFLFVNTITSQITIPTVAEDSSWFQKFIVVPVVKGLVSLLNSLDIRSVLESFNEQILSCTDIIYFVSIIAAFLFLSVRALDKRRWS